MTLRLPVYALCLVGVISSPAVAQKPQTTAFVTVVAPADAPMTNLTAKDFKAQGGRFEIAEAVRSTGPLSIEILVDISRAPYGTNPPIQDLRTALETFVQTIRGGDPSAQIALMAVGNAAVPVVDFDAPPAALDKAVGTVAPGPETGAVMIEGVQDAARALAKRPAPRRAIVAVDFASGDTIPENVAERAVKDVYGTGATLWAVSVRGSVQQPPMREQALNMIVKGNGGERLTINVASGLKNQLQSVANSLLSQYNVTIAGIDPPHVRDVKLSTASGAKVVTSLFAQ
jgi:hypothetical protein